VTRAPEGPRARGRIVGSDVHDDVEREIRAHLERRAEELVEEGWSPEDAAREARRRFGDVEGVARACRAITRGRIRAERRTGMWEQIIQDVRYGLRALARAPEFTLVALVTLGLGIGANTAIFSVVDSVLLDPLPYEEPGDIVWLRERNTRGGAMGVAWANFADWRAQARSFGSLAAYGAGPTTVLGAGEPQVVTVASVTDELWSVFRARPASGRLTVPEDHVPGAEPVGVVSERFWRSALGGAPLGDLVLDLGGDRVRLVGAVGDGFDFPSGADVWVPVDEAAQSDSRSAHNWDVVGRLAPGTSLASAAAEMEALTVRLVADAPEDPDFLATGTVVSTLHERVVGPARRPLLLLLGAAGLVLLVACTNLASTLLARGATRGRELAVRASLGAPRGRIARQLLTESALLAALGTLVGLGVAQLGLAALRRLGPESVPRLAEIGMDGTVLGYAAGLAVLTVLVFGLLPARRASRGAPGDALREGARGNAMDGRSPVWRVLVAGEVALALFLLVSSAVVVRSFRNLLAEDTGFDGSDVATVEARLSTAKYPTAAEQVTWFEAFAREVEAIPGVDAVGFVSALPMEGLPNGRVELDGDLDKHAVGLYALATAGAFEALDVPLLRGRLFDERDGPDGAHVAIVSESFAETYWPGEDPIGKSVTGGGMDELWQTRTFSEVIGVVGDVRWRALGREPEPTIYFHPAQRPSRVPFGANLVVESATGDADALAPVLRATLQRLDPDVPPRVSTVGAQLGASVAPERFLALLLGSFALLALVLAGAGIYGVVSYQVAQRTREMGIRIALGGAPAAVRRMVVGQSLAIVGVGLALGVGGVLLGGRALASLLYGVRPADPASLALAALLLGLAAALASWVPAARGTRVDPMITMRAD